MSIYEAWKATLHDKQALIKNDGRFSDGVRVWTPFPGPHSDDWDDFPGTASAGYCAPDWPWLQGRVLGQIDTNDWFVFLDYYKDLPFLCQRNVADLHRVVLSDGGE